MSGVVSKLELKTGMQHLGLMMTQQEFQNFWATLFKLSKELPHKTNKDGSRVKTQSYQRD
jgi:hypothetical protein